MGSINFLKVCSGIMVMHSPYGCANGIMVMHSPYGCANGNAHSKRVCLIYANKLYYSICKTTILSCRNVPGEPIQSHQTWAHQIQILHKLNMGTSNPTQLIPGARKTRHIQRLPKTSPACSLGCLLPQNSPELHFQIISDHFYSSLTLTIF